MNENDEQFAKQQRYGGWHFSWRWLIAIVALVYFLVYMPTPYVIYTPGSAESIKPLVDVKGGDDTEQGAFMLTTVRRTYANMGLIVWHSFNSDAQFGKKQDALQGRSEAEYETELVFSMSGSQSNAILAAYHAANVPYDKVNTGLYVIYNLPNVSSNEFKTQDRLLSIEGQKVNTVKEVKTIIAKYKEGQTLTVQIEREGKKQDVKAKLVRYKPYKQAENTVVGFGTTFGEKVDIVPRNPKDKITFHESDIGGPSAGLMFTLELINRLTPGDLSRGHLIAGTGEITPEGKVGMIGGVQHKVVAAHQEGASLFLVPEGNYEEAKAKVDTMDTKMKLVSVRTLQDALTAIEQLEVKAVKPDMPK
ncbi:YlbL family protein [Paenibacillus assamensis]|uniref:YlbL family protein n=1 Tax=Paenibacillus assamensis TaxID=311244 RepID=UPI00040DC71D|nr:S16 family serine protease [Paenibacillus assamensis]